MNTPPSSPPSREALIYDKHGIYFLFVRHTPPVAVLNVINLYIKWKTLYKTFIIKAPTNFHKIIKIEVFTFSERNNWCLYQLLQFNVTRRGTDKITSNL